MDALRRTIAKDEGLTTMEVATLLKTIQSSVGRIGRAAGWFIQHVDTSNHTVALLVNPKTLKQYASQTEPEPQKRVRLGRTGNAVKAR
jgi:hypothetical protein